VAEAIELEVAGRPVRVSNPDKIYFPAIGPDGGTKRHLVEYYISVGEGIVRALRNRPTYLQRFPDGITGEEVYQKRLPSHAPEWLSTCRVTFPSGRHADALRVQEPAGIAWAANLGTVTFHPWHARCDDVDHPDELRIDLDPQPGTDFDDARQVALRSVRQILDELGWIGFPKTSGNRGVHVYVRIQPRWTFTEVRHAAIALAREIERRDPDGVTTRWWKEERGSKVFVDYNQNARDRTIASAYSVRRRPDATVSTPLTWDELGDVETQDFTIATVPERFARLGDLHAAIDDVSHDLTPLLQWYERDERDHGEADMPYPPNYPKMPGEPKRVQPSRAKPLTCGNTTRTVLTVEL
jgi:DNA ligase D